MSSKYLNDSGLAYFWTKIKAYVAGLLGAKADDADVVHKTGDESIDGHKVFLQYVRSMSSFSAKRTYFADDIHVSENTYGTLVDMVDRDGNLLAELYYGQESDDDTVFVLRSRSKDRSSNGYVTLRHYESSDVFVLEIPTPPADSNTFHAASTSWVRSLLASDTGVVHTTGNETINGYKVFNNSVESWGDFHTISDLFDGATIYNDTRYQYCINIRDKNSSVMADSYYGRTGGATGSTVWAFRLYSPDKTKAGYLQLFYWPSTDTFTATAPIPPSTSNGNDIATTSWVRSFGNDAYLPLTGGTLTGALKFKRSNITRGTAPSSDSILSLADCVDSANNRISLIESTYYTDMSSKVALFAYKTTVASGANIGSIGIGCTSAGNVYTFAPTPDTSDNSTQIATTAFVKSQGYLTSHQSLDSCVKTSGDQIISGTKTFNSRIMGTLSYKNTNIDPNGSNPSSTQYCTLCAVENINGNYFNEMYTAYSTNGDNSTVIRTHRKDRSATNSWTVLMPNGMSRGYSYGNLYKDMFFINNGADLGTIPSSTQWWSLAFQDKDGENFGGVWFNASTSGSCEYAIRCNTNLASGRVTKTIWIYQKQDKTSAAGVDADVFRPTLKTFAKLGDTGDSRWGQIYSTSSTISTSDERQKCEISSIPDEILDAWELCEFYQYKMLDSVDKKGNNARYHTGMIAQRLKSKFDAVDKNLDKYGLFCYDEWGASEARLDENGNITEPAVEAGNEYSIRYEEALCMEAAYQRRENVRLKKRIADLEERLAALELKLKIA